MTCQNKAGRIFKIAKIVKGTGNNSEKATDAKDPGTVAVIVDKDGTRRGRPH